MFLILKAAGKCSGSKWTPEGRSIHWSGLVPPTHCLGVALSHLLSIYFAWGPGDDKGMNQTSFLPLGCQIMGWQAGMLMGFTAGAEVREAQGRRWALEALDRAVIHERSKDAGHPGNTRVLEVEERILGGGY